MTERNPYIGPQSFRTKDKDLFFGRSIESNNLFSLIIAHRVLLLYAQSGSGKSSLINASIIPKLQDEGFKTMPVARVGLSKEENIFIKQVSNIYVYNSILHWVDEAESAMNYSHLSLTKFLGKIDEPRLIVFDQFEELFTTFPDRWKERQNFLQQLGEALDHDHLIRVVLVMREDYIAQLEPYLEYFPERLRTRFRLERLKIEPAIEAVERPLHNYNRSFAAGTAKKLVQDLLKIKIDSLDGNISEFEGEYVDPVQLQLTCFSLWESIPKETQLITDNDLIEFSNIDEILGHFYAKIIKSVSTRHFIKEIELRLFFENYLITNLGTRGTIYRGKEETAGIPNRVISELERNHLICTERRSGARWYELNHDRFINPILKSNKAYFQNSRTSWQNLFEEQLNYSDMSEDQLNEVLNRTKESKEIETQFETLYSIGEIMLTKGKCKSALEVFLYILEMDKTFILAYYGRASTYWYLGEHIKAYNDFGIVLSFIDNSFPAILHYLVYHNRGQVLAEMDRNREAIEDLLKALEIEKEIGQSPGYARNGLALALGNIGEFEKSFLEFKKAIEEHPDNAWVFYNRALIYEKAHEFQYAIDDYLTSLVKNNPSLPDERRQRAEIRLKELVSNNIN